MQDELSTPDLSAVHLHQYTGLWAIEGSYFSQQLALVQAMDLGAHVSRSTPRSAPTVSAPDADGIAVLEIRGTLTKQGSSLSDAGSTVRIRQTVREAKRDPRVKGVLIVIDSPGGTVAGTAELADDVLELATVKPVITFAEDLMASAAVWVGSQARKVFANTSNAVIGSVGAFIGLYDLSEKAAKDGIKPVLIKTGDLKGTGFPGTEITDAQKQMLQGLADSSYEVFSTHIQRTRKLSKEQLKEISRAGIFTAHQAIGLGLIDGIRTEAAAMAELRTMIGSSSNATPTITRPAVQAVPSPIHSTMLPTAASPTPPLKEQTMSTATTITATEQWHSAVSALTASGLDKAAAIRQVVSTRPDLHQAYLAEVNGRPAVPFRSLSEGTTSAAQAWQAAIAELTAGGLDKSMAVRRVVSTRPDLHQAYLAEVNGR